MATEGWVVKWTGKQTQALENFRAVGGWSTSVEALVEGPAAEGLHRKGLLEKRKILKKTREVAQYRVAQHNALANAPATAGD